MTTTITILGCGSSGGVPRIGNDWGICDPANPKNRRRRCSVMVERKGPNGITRVIIDTSPDMREQMLSVNVGEIDGVWYTHEHADHTHGIDELRGFFLRQRKRVPIWADASNMAMLKSRFAYYSRSGGCEDQSDEHRCSRVSHPGSERHCCSGGRRKTPPPPLRR